MIRKGLRENWTFWAAVAVLGALFPIVVWWPGPSAIWVLLLDFLIAMGLVCVWLERQLSKPSQAIPVVVVREEDLEKLKEAGGKTD